MTKGAGKGSATSSQDKDKDKEGSRAAQPAASSQQRPASSQQVTAHNLVLCCLPQQHVQTAQGGVSPF